MRRIIFILFFISLFINSYSQVFDLIVNTNGDSIACHIDSITDTHIYFEMKIKNNWIHTNLIKSTISNYQLNAINKKLIKFIPETSYIESTLVKINSMKEIQKNSIYCELGGLGGFFSFINYDRLIVFNEYSGIILRVGWGDSFLFETNYLLGRNKHFLEIGIGATGFIEKLDWYDIQMRIGYRLQYSNGFLIRFSPNLEYNNANVVYDPYDESISPWGIWFGISFGYSF